MADDNHQSATLRRQTVNKATVDPICKLLNLPEHVFTASELTTSDVELLLDVLLNVCAVVLAGPSLTINYLH